MSRLLGIVPVLNLWETYTRPMLQSLVAPEPLALVLIDNGSDGSACAAQQLPAGFREGARATSALEQSTPARRGSRSVAAAGGAPANAALFPHTPEGPGQPAPPPRAPPTRRFEQNREYYVRKWGGPPGQEWYRS